MAQGNNGNSGGVSTAVSPAGGGGSFFEPLKPQQGKRVRGVSACVAGVLVVWGAYFFYNMFHDLGMSPIIYFGFPAVFFIGTAYATFHFLARSQRSVDFLIQTDAELKKVHWSSRKEIIGSTKVVIFVMLFMAVMLFVVDIVLMFVFQKIGVLRGGDSIIPPMGG